MSIEGLQAILNKEPVVGTQAADTLCQNPQMVEDAYLRHVRSYVPLGRAAQDDEATMTVAEFERRLIDLVKRAAAPTGYVTADYGYGKTSTCLYLWDRCRRANLIAVPPFEFVQLADLLRVTHAWVRYEVEKRTPALACRADEIFNRYVTRSIEDMAGGDATRLTIYRDLLARGQLVLDLAASRYVQFFEEMVALALESGYEGLVVIADEFQQYINPQLSRGEGELAPLFDLVQGLVSRKGTVRFGLIFSIPRDTLVWLNDRRGDLVQRLKVHGLAFDLRSVYGAAFATQLWAHLTKLFDCQQEAPSVVTPSTLAAIGEIAARDDLANGPRTVVNAFSTMIARYLRTNGRAPYTPLDLIDDFLSGTISFDGTSKLQTVINQRLASPTVAGNAERERAVRLVAAFPTYGCGPAVLEEFGLRAAADELAAAGQGEIVTFRGGGMDREGRQLPFGMTLVGLEPDSKGAADWLTTTLKEFWRLYYENDAHTLRRVLAGFGQLLRERVFTQPHFSVQEIREGRLTQSAGFLLEGSFQATARTYPKRRVHVRLLLADEPARDRPEGDLTIEFRLLAHLDQPEQARWQLPGSLNLDDARTAVIALNLSHRASDTIYAELERLQPIINPHKLTPLFMLALHGYLEEKRAAGLIPHTDDPLIKGTFQASLLDRSMVELFNAELGAPLGKAGVALVEEVFRRQCQTLFPNYVTFMTATQWQPALRDYQRALQDKALPSVLERRGDQPFETSKDKLATMLGRTATTLDNFFSSYPTLLTLETPFGGKSQGQQGAVRFTLHPLERAFMKMLHQSAEVVPYQLGRQSKQVHRIALDVLYRRAQEDGYRDEEIKAALDLLAARDLIIIQEQQRGVLESPRGVIEVPALREDVEKVVAALTTPLLAYYTTDTVLRQHHEQFTKLLAILNGREKPTEDMLIRMANDVEARERQIQTFIADRMADVRNRLAALVAPSVIETSRVALLNSALPQHFFGLQLDKVRTTLLHEAQRYLQAVQDWQAHQRRLAEQRAFEGADATGLISLATSLESLQKAARSLHGQRQAFDLRFGGFASAEGALQTASAIEEMLAGAGDKDTAGVALRAEFDELVRTINGDLSSRGADALEHAGDWAIHLRQLLAKVRSAIEGEEVQFKRLQERYRQSLLDLGVPVEKLPRETPFNRLDPRGSLHKLHDDMRLVLVGRMEGLPARLETVQALLDQQESRCAEHDQARMAPILARIAETRAALAADRRQISELSAQAGDLDVIGDFPETGEGQYRRFMARFRDLITSIGAIRAAVNQIKQDLDEIGKERSKETPEQQRLLQAIQVAQQPGASYVDIGKLRQDDLPIADLMRVLGELYQGGKVLVRVSIPAGGAR